ncbi:transcription factor IIA, alpha/beta subunit-domain-containing protein [Lipomyces arxii]|uniref:transcription factor IIA, alpha/beta subunit-domain-containing protein n=1 Tax=Lipomyces arxii TaxID=56418 RepID=UPI0034CFD556
MSNSIVGNAYRDIIDDVINSSRIDFEDAGIDETTLRELQLLWQTKLSNLKVATFPWDPEPTVESDLGLDGGVKYEYPSPPLYGAGMTATPQAFSNPAMAAMRAAQHIQEFAREEKVPAAIADASIKGVMKRAGLDESNADSDGPNGSGGGLILPGGGRIAQVDGVSDDSEFTKEDVDRLLELNILRNRCQVHSSASNMTRNMVISVKKNKSSKKYEFTLSQADGTLDSSDDDDSEEDDDDDIANVGGGTGGAGRRHNNNGNNSDAINSDLDDPDDELNSQDDDDGDESGMIMLCLYDKVTRTKNKWKCVLKDGIVNVNGKDYLFGKGSGEYEW